MTEQKYLSRGKQSKKWHLERDCGAVKSSDLKPVADSEVPDSAGPCSQCAGGIRAYDLAKLGEQSETEKNRHPARVGVILDD